LAQLAEILKTLRASEATGTVKNMFAAYINEVAEQVERIGQGGDLIAATQQVQQAFSLMEQNMMRPYVNRNKNKRTWRPFHPLKRHLHPPCNIKKMMMPCLDLM